MTEPEMERKERRGRQASVNGFAHEHIVTGILMKRYQNVSLVDLPLSTYDIIIVRKTTSGQEDIIRAQVKTARRATNSIPFVGGSRAGVDRTYKTGIKTYRYSTKTSDVVIGVYAHDSERFDLYFVPTILIEELGQKTVSLNRIAPLKN
ncbi:hypothetical protein MUP77_18870, partial [Candidatus Bathyarchaeota archaeon]|nr:hypothetical protein [Candidatus Bathyarchaeota archaeon]